MTDPTIHLYLVDPRLNLLLALRTVPLQEDFFAALRRHTKAQLAAPFEAADHQRRVGAIYQRLTPAAMRERAIAVQEIPLDIRNAPVH